MKNEKSHMSKSKPCFEILGKKLNHKKIPPGGGGGGRWWEGGAGWNFFLEFDTFFWYSIWKYFQFDFPRFQGAIWKLLSQEFQNRSYFLTYLVWKNRKLSPKLSTYRWDTLYNTKVGFIISLYNVKNRSGYIFSFLQNQRFVFCTKKWTENL